MKKFLVVFAGLLLLAGCEQEGAVVLDDQQNRAPEAFDLVIPAEGAELDVYDIAFEWTRSEDPEKQKVTYDVYLVREGSSPVKVAENLIEPSYVMNERTVFNHSFRWYVVAKDEQQRETMSPERTFTTRPMQTVQMHDEASQNLFPERYAYTGIYFNDRFMIMNGYANGTMGDVWHSTDYGQQWSMQSNMTGTDFERYGHSSVIFNDKLYIMGGYRDGQPLADMYSTMNGMDWMQEMPSGMFMPRYEHTSLVFKNKMWIIGGYNDQMYMDDVMSWTGNMQDPWMMEVEGMQTPFDGMRGHSSVVYDEKMWIMGGMNRNGEYMKKVWYSEDGVNWMPGKDMPMMSAYHKSVVFDDKMWIIGGLNESGASNQVYYYDKNTDMWMPYEMPMDFRPMYNHSVIVVNKGMPEDGIYILGSYDGTNYIRGMWKMY